MTKDEIKAFVELKQADMPFLVRDRAEALPLDGRDIITIPSVRCCGKSSRMEVAFQLNAKVVMAFGGIALLVI